MTLTEFVQAYLNSPLGLPGVRMMQPLEVFIAAQQLELTIEGLKPSRPYKPLSDAELLDKYHLKFTMASKSTNLLKVLAEVGKAQGDQEVQITYPLDREQRERINIERLIKGDYVIIMNADHVLGMNEIKYFETATCSGNRISTHRASVWREPPQPFYLLEGDRSYLPRNYLLGFAKVLETAINHHLFRTE